MTLESSCFLIKSSAVEEELNETCPNQKMVCLNGVLGCLRIPLWKGLLLRGIPTFPYWNIEGLVINHHHSKRWGYYGLLSVGGGWWHWGVPLDCHDDVPDKSIALTHLVPWKLRLVNHGEDFRDRRELTITRKRLKYTFKTFATVVKNQHASSSYHISLCTIIPISSHHIFSTHLPHPFLIIPIPCIPPTIPSYHPGPSFTLQKDVNGFIGNGQKEGIRRVSRGSDLDGEDWCGCETRWVCLPPKKTPPLKESSLPTTIFPGLC